ncbi:hypothetical protein BH10PLA1_BH10PLA1_12240 [soil metagenome]
MSFIKRWLFRVALAACVMTSGNSLVPTPANPAKLDHLATGLPPEVRIRKLHLVRPDLIPYPIAFEVYC